MYNSSAGLNIYLEYCLLILETASRLRVLADLQRNVGTADIDLRVLNRWVSNIPTVGQIYGVQF